MLLDRREWPLDTVRVHWHPLVDLKPRRLRSRFRAKYFQENLRRRRPKKAAMARALPRLEDEHGVSDAHDVFYACGVPICQSNAAMAGSPADGLRIVRAVNANARFV